MTVFTLQLGGFFPAAPGFAPAAGAGIASGTGFSLANIPLFGKKKGADARRKIHGPMASGTDAKTGVGSIAENSGAGASAHSEQLVDPRSDENLLAAYLGGERAAFPK